jgi:hypothetical protein
MERLFKVQISYQEPMYHLHHGSHLRTFTGTFTVRAEDEYLAEETARRRFHELALDSSVGWTRKIVTVEVKTG